jgi:hypothetical protein
MRAYPMVYVWKMWLKRIVCIPSRIAGEKDFGPHDRESANRDELSD